MPSNPEPKQKAAAALRSMFVGDSLAMPVHWYYRAADIFRQFPGGIFQLEAAPDHHPSSIMALHSTSRGGRGTHGADSGPQIVGDVILKGKREYWGKTNQHYHRGMKAGENTLNAHCARALMRSLGSNHGRYSEEDFLDAYIQLMTAASPQHPDTYAESYHRGFFANLQLGKARNECGAVTHDTPSVGGLVTIAPIVFAERLRGTSLAEVQVICRQHLRLTHPDQSLEKVCGDYVALLDAVLFAGTDQFATGNELPVQEMIAAYGRRSVGLDLPALLNKTSNDSDVVGGMFSTACYITDSWPCVLFLAYKYSSDLKSGLLANANLGGDNAHRGAVLGTILGLGSGTTIEEFYARLVDHSQLEREISDLLNL